jgi:hypothetical protein
MPASFARLMRSVVLCSALLRAADSGGSLPPASSSFCSSPMVRLRRGSARQGVCLHEQAGPHPKLGVSRDSRAAHVRKFSGRPRGPSPAQIQLNKRLSRCDSLDAVLVEVHAAEDSALALTAVNMVTAVHRVAKLSSTARSLQFPEALLLLERIDNELTQVRILKSQDFSDIM